MVLAMVGLLAAVGEHTAASAEMGCKARLQARLQARLRYIGIVGQVAVNWAGLALLALELYKWSDSLFPAASLFPYQ